MSDDVKNFVALCQAVKTVSLDVLREMLVKYGRKVISKLLKLYKEQGETPLMLAIQGQHNEMVKFLVTDLSVSIGEVARFTWKLNGKT